MPIYQYQCTTCKHNLDVLTDQPGKDYDECDKCGYPAKRVMSAPNFKINGYNEGNGYADDGS